jgi:TPP-dependent pyruvate/acetoin dehydrogenase alpha subunit
VLDNKLMDRGELPRIKDEVAVEVIEAQAFAKNSPRPGREELTKYVFA